MSLNRSDFRFIRATAEAAMIDTCSVQRFSQEQDGQGGMDNTAWGFVALDIPCLIATLRDSAPVELGQREHAAGTRFLTVPFDQDIRSNDRILFEGESFEVLEVRTNSYDSALRCRIQARD